MKIRNKRILALLSTTAFVVVAGTMSGKADETTDKQAYLDGSRRELVGGYQLPADVAGVTREATLVSGTGTQALFDTVTTITSATNTTGVVSGPYEAPFVNSGIAQVPYLDGVSDVRNVTINMEGGSVGNLWGTFQYSDVASGKITHNISGGTVGRLYGGANLNNTTNALPAYTPGQVTGVEINISGGTVGQIRGGNSSGEGGADSAQAVGAGGVTINLTGGTVGKAGQQDAIRAGGGAYNDVDGKVTINISGDDTTVLGDVYAGGRQSTVDSTEINISGGEITGDVYGGGTYDAAAATVTNDTKINISGGTINGDVYGAGMNDQVGGNTSIVMTGDTARVNGTLYGGSNNSAAATAGTVGGMKSIDFGTADAAYTGSVNLADFTEVNINNGTTTIESLTNAAEGTNVTVELNGTLDTRAGVISDVENLTVLGGTLNIDMNGSNDTGVSGKSLTLTNGSRINVTNAADDSESISVFGFDEVEDMGEVAITLNGNTVSANLWDLSNGMLTIKELSAATLSLTPNQRHFYAALQAMEADGNASPQISSIVNSRDEAAVKAQLNAMSGHEYATAMASQLDGNIGHLRRLRASMGKGAPLGARTTGGQAVCNKSGEIMTTNEITDMRRWRMGVQGFYEQSKIDADSHGDGYDRTEAGAMLLAEYFVCDALTMGAAVSYGRTTLDTDNARRRHEDNTRFDLYGLYGSGRWSTATSIGMGFHNHDMRRHKLHATDADGYSINFMHEAAYALMRSETSSLQLFGAVESSWNRLDSFRERGGADALYIRKQDAWATDVTMGVRFNMELMPLGNAPAGMFSLQTGATGSVGDVNPAVRMSMNGYDYRQECAGRDRWGWEIGAGVDVPLTESISLFGTAETIIRGDSHTFDAQVGMRVTF